jgi:hypothetical protein
MTVTLPVSPLGDAVRVEEVPDPQVPERAKRRSYSAKYKAAILAEYDGLDRDGRGALMRREGLYSSLAQQAPHSPAPRSVTSAGLLCVQRRPVRSPSFRGSRPPSTRPSTSQRPHCRRRGGAPDHPAMRAA